jgi:hypothetical protein
MRMCFLLGNESLTKEKEDTMLLKTLSRSAFCVVSVLAATTAFGNIQDQNAPWKGMASVKATHDFEQCVVEMQNTGAEINQVFLSFGVAIVTIPQAKQVELSLLPCIEALEEEKVMEGGGVAGVTN